MEQKLAFSVNWDKYVVSASGPSNGDCALFTRGKRIYKVVWSFSRFSKLVVGSRLMVARTACLNGGQNVPFS